MTETAPGGPAQSTAQTEDALTLLAEVTARWPDLVESRLKGTPRITQSRPARNPNDLEPGEGLGSLPAPIHLDILDAMASIVMWADMLHELVAQTVGHDRLEPAVSALADPRPFLRYVEALLPEAAGMDDEIVEAVTEKAERMRSLLLGKLGEVYDGQRLEAVCPFCVGRTFEKLAGERTLYVRVVPVATGHEGLETVVVCENTVGCTPFARECDMWVRGAPAWPIHRWGWLADRLLPARVA